MKKIVGLIRGSKYSNTHLSSYVSDILIKDSTKPTKSIASYALSEKVKNDLIKYGIDVGFVGVAIMDSKLKIFISYIEGNTRSPLIQNKKYKFSLIPTHTHYVLSNNFINNEFIDKLNNSDKLQYHEIIRGYCNVLGVVSIDIFKVLNYYGYEELTTSLTDPLLSISDKEKLIEIFVKSLTKDTELELYLNQDDVIYVAPIVKCCLENNIGLNLHHYDYVKDTSIIQKVL